MNDRDYQKQAIEQTIQALAEPGSATLGVAATGMGKTHIFCRVAQYALEHWGGRVLILAHRAELVYQAAKRIELLTDDRCDIEMADQRADMGYYFDDRARVIVASKDSIAHRMAKFDWSEFALVITDEAHHSVAQRYRKIYEEIKAANPGIRHFGVTATPDRLDKLALDNVYGSVAFNFDMLYGIRNGWLCDVRQSVPIIEGLDYSKVRRTAGDLNLKDASKILEAREMILRMARPVVELAKWRQTLIFTASVHQAEEFAEILNGWEPGCARWICGKTPDDERKQILADYRQRRFQFLVNVDVFTEGFDEPGIEVVAMCRPTLSRAKYAQMIGRGTRTLPGVIDGIESAEERVEAIKRSRKPYLEVIDFAGNSGRHKLVTAVDILGGERDDQFYEAAHKVQRGRTAESVSEIIEDAEREIERAKEERRRRRELRLVGKMAKKVGVRYKVKRVDPFDVFDIQPSRTHPSRSVPPTPKQVEILERNGIDPEGLTRRQASQMIDEIFHRRKNGLPTFKQTRFLKRHNAYREGMTFEEAREAIDSIIKRKQEARG